MANFLASEFFTIPYFSFPIYIIAGLLLLFNFSYQISTVKLQNTLVYNEKLVNIIINVQIIIDIIMLTGILHFSGGVENPFIIYYVFHMIIASILLSRLNSFITVTFSLISVGILAFSENTGVIPHYKLDGFLNVDYYNDTIYILGTGFIFITTSYIIIYLTSTVTKKLKKQEEAYKEANIILLEQDKIKNEYVYQITHDIKGHIASIKHCVEAAKLIVDTEKKNEFIVRALDRSNTLTTFINELMRITQLRLNQSFEMDFFSIKDALNNVISNASIQIENKNIKHTFTIDDSVDKIFGNRFLIEEALSNIIQNAIKYTAQNGTIKTNCYSENDKVVIEISDSGIGIPEDQIHQIFKEFFRASNAKEQEKESNGLGLSIVQKIIQKHNGKIIVNSIVNKGTTFKVILPITDSEIIPIKLNLETGLMS